MKKSLILLITLISFLESTAQLYTYVELGAPTISKNSISDGVHPSLGTVNLNFDTKRYLRTGARLENGHFHVHADFIQFKQSNKDILSSNFTFKNTSFLENEAVFSDYTINSLRVGGLFGFGESKLKTRLGLGISIQQNRFLMDTDSKSIEYFNRGNFHFQPLYKGLVRYDLSKRFRFELEGDVIAFNYYMVDASSSVNFKLNKKFNISTGYRVFAIQDTNQDVFENSFRSNSVFLRLNYVIDSWGYSTE